MLAAYALNRVGASSEALVYWRRAARLEPANAPLQNELGATARDAGAFAESLAAYRAAIAASPTNAVAYNNLAIDLKDMGDVVGARRAHGAALRASPNFSPMVHLNLLHLDLDMASWRHWPLYAWRAARRPPVGAEAEWPWSRLEARAYLSGSAALLNAAAARRGGGGASAHAAAKWEGCGRCRKRPPPLAPPGARAPLRVALLSDLDQDPSARLLARALNALLGAATRRGGRPVDAPQIEPLLALDDRRRRRRPRSARSAAASAPSTCRPRRPRRRRASPRSGRRRLCARHSVCFRASGRTLSSKR